MMDYLQQIASSSSVKYDEKYLQTLAAFKQHAADVETEKSVIDSLLVDSPPESTFVRSLGGSSAIPPVSPFPYTYADNEVEPQPLSRAEQITRTRPLATDEDVESVRDIFREHEHDMTKRKKRKTRTPVPRLEPSDISGRLWLAQTAFKENQMWASRLSDMYPAKMPDLRTLSRGVSDAALFDLQLQQEPTEEEAEESTQRDKKRRGDFDKVVRKMSVSELRAMAHTMGIDCMEVSGKLKRKRTLQDEICMKTLATHE